MEVRDGLAIQIFVEVVATVGLRFGGNWLGESLKG